MILAGRTLSSNGILETLVSTSSQNLPLPSPSPFLLVARKIGTHVFSVSHFDGSGLLVWVGEVVGRRKFVGGRWRLSNLDTAAKIFDKVQLLLSFVRFVCGGDCVFRAGLVRLGIICHPDNRAKIDHS
jgi:hypothetical protein